MLISTRNAARTKQRKYWLAAHPSWVAMLSQIGANIFA
jgi:hypothetical protein